LRAFHRAHAGFAELRPLYSPTIHLIARRSRRRRAARLLTSCAPSANEQDAVMTSNTAHERATGRVKFFNETKGFGFIIRDDGAGEVFVHRTDLPAEIVFLYEGQAVSFDIESTKRGLRAANIAVAAQ
jgi:cold shock protein